MAEGFHALGYNVLFYDARSVGGSGGSLRNLIDPLQMAEDLSGERYNLARHKRRGSSHCPFPIQTSTPT